jgi:two-component system, LytTR family, response regulator
MDYYYFKRNDSVHLPNVMLLEALENYTLFHLEDGSKIMSSLTLKRHQEKLSDAQFIRANRSTMINLSFIDWVELFKHTGFVHLKNGNIINVSRRRKDTFLHLAS